MATLIGPMAAAATKPFVGATAFGQPSKIVGYYALAAALAVNDILQMVGLMPGSKVTDGALHVPDLDSNGTPTITLAVGYGTDDDYFIVANTVGQAGGIARFGATAGAAFSTGGPLTLSATDEDTVDIKVAAGPATGVATGTLYLTVEFLAPGSY